MENSISRKGFLASATLLGIGSILSRIPANEHSTVLDANPDLVLDSDEGEVYLIGERQGRITIKVDKQNKGIETLSLLTEDIRPGDGIPVHKHSSEEELILLKKEQGYLHLEISTMKLHLEAWLWFPERSGTGFETKVLKC